MMRMSAGFPLRRPASYVCSKKSASESSMPSGFWRSGSGALKTPLETSVLPPTTGIFSTMRTRPAPASFADIAALKPAAPLPTTRTSTAVGQSSAKDDARAKAREAQRAEAAPIVRNLLLVASMMRVNSKNRLRPFEVAAGIRPPRRHCGSRACGRPSPDAAERSCRQC